MCDIRSDAHLTFDPKQMIHHATKMLKRYNSRLSSKYVERFASLVMNTECFSTNTYHIAAHTYEVLQMTTHLLGFVPKGYFTPTEHTILQIAALCHDYGHIGIRNTEWDDSSIRERLSSYSSFSELDEYNEKSYNELMHVELAMEHILKYKKHLFGSFSEISLKSIISKLIESTDLNVHDKYMEAFVTRGRCKSTTMMVILKLADISHILRPFHVHLVWVYRHHVESKAKEMDVQDISKDSIWFANTYVRPLLDLFVTQHPSARCLSEHLETNLQIWTTHCN